MAKIRTIYLRCQGCRANRAITDNDPIRLSLIEDIFRSEHEDCDEGGGDGMENLIRAVWRMARIEIALVIALYLTNLAGRPELIILAPLLNGLSKYLRDQYKLDLKVV